MGARRGRLVAAMAAAWEAEVVSARALSALSECMVDPRVRARLMVLCAFCRAHASLLLARLSALGRGPLPVPDSESPLDASLALALRKEAASARAAAARYAAMAEMARGQADLSSAWVCELNRTEEEDRANELLSLSTLPLADLRAGGLEPAGLG